MYRIIAFTDAFTTCECCGKTDLKGTFCVELDGEEMYFGRVCAFKKHVSIEDIKEAEATFKKAKRLEKESYTLSQLLESVNMSSSSREESQSKMKVIDFIGKSNCLDLSVFLRENGQFICHSTAGLVYSYGYSRIIVKEA